MIQPQSSLNKPYDLASEPGIFVRGVLGVRAVVRGCLGSQTGEGRNRCNKTPGRAGSR